MDPAETSTQRQGVVPPGQTKAAPIFGLIDANNFYCSAEQSLRPSLGGKPLVVLSNNDGAVIARSNEARALGIKMAQPYFEVRHLEEKAGLIALSANFELYGDLSQRVMSLAAGLGHRQEIYSIDLSAPGYCCVSFEKEVVDWCCD